MALLIFIATLWLVVLTPGFLKRRSERQSVGSIDHFHHQLHLLERTGPKLVTPAYRLQTAEAATAAPVGASGFPSISSMPRRPNLVLLQPVGEEESESAAELVEDGAGGHYRRVGPPVELLEPTPPADGPRLIRMADPERYRRQQLRRRRRDTLALLAGTTALTALLGLVPSLRMLWVLTALGLVGLAGYVGLAVQAARLASSNGPARTGNSGLGPRAVDTAVAGYPGAWDEYDERSTSGAGEYGDYEPVRRVAAR